jgi:hypothetical protein
MPREAASNLWPRSNRYCDCGETSGARPVCSSRSSAARVLYGLTFIIAGASLALKCSRR